ncbi:VTC domain-containing protein [Cetobacterium ceti]|uniref:VTC domain-containing protein n=1 Tax=Cetobacterium ceti TaxID=180163 RepID=A0A1T4K301_9FUSO|nr:polyphosphate polymerase domain-containing protein [Cetobacterium ceti]SJZ36725.1 VTC domain-containing protein [Cetobacterium ceti]
MNKEVLKVTRSEEKYFISIPDKYFLMKSLKNILQEDSFGDHGFYKVRTLYFDNPTNKDYLDKVNNTPSRKGIRLRTYFPKSNFAKIEVKMKNPEIDNKISLKISQEDAKEIINLNYDVLKNYSNKKALEIYNILTEENYKPVIVIAYNRKAFDSREYGLRITIDNNLEYNNHNFDIFDPNLTLTPLCSFSENILEIKTEKILPLNIQTILDSIEKIDKASSKYKRSRFFLNSSLF